MTGLHATLAPSGAPRRGLCAGSRAAEAARPPQPEGPEAAEGTAAHWVCAEMLHDRLAQVGQIAPNGVVVDQGMIDGANLYVGDIMLQTGDITGLVESFGTAHFIHHLCEGTPDFRVFREQRRTIFVHDYKYGHGYVEVIDNLQLIEYVAIEAERLGFDGLEDQLIKVVMTVVQPRWYGKGGPIRRWETTLAGMRAHFNFASSREHASMADGALRVAGPDQCRDCTARVQCEQFWQAGGAAMSFAGESAPFDPTAHQVGRQLQQVQHHMSMLKAMEAGLMAEGAAMAFAGKNVTGYTVERSSTREAWRKPAEQVIAMAEAYGVDVRKPDALVTPNQARKLGIDESVIAAYSGRPPGELRLVPFDISHTRKVFGT